MKKIICAIIAIITIGVVLSLSACVPKTETNGAPLAPVETDKDLEMVKSILRRYPFPLMESK